MSAPDDRPSLPDVLDCRGGKVTCFRYVPHRRRDAYARMGWAVVADLGPHHGIYCVLMEWRGDGEPREPEESA